MEHLWYSIVCEHCDFVDVVEFAIAFALEACPQIGNEDLRSFVEAHRLAFETSLVLKAGEVVDDEVHQRGC